jgi:hypothetical protein
MPQNATPDANDEALSAQQDQALEYLLTGSTVTAAAAAAGVDRSTVHRWLRADVRFATQYERRRRELVEATEARLLMLADRAVGVVEQALADGDSRAALSVLKGLGLLAGTPPTLGPDDPATWERARRKEAHDAMMQDIMTSMPLSG